MIPQEYQDALIESRPLKAASRKRRQRRLSRRKRLLLLLVVVSAVIVMAWLFNGRPWWHYSMDIDRSYSTMEERDAIEVAETVDLPGLLNTSRFKPEGTEMYSNDVPGDPLGWAEILLIDRWTVGYYEQRVDAFKDGRERVDIEVRYEVSCERRTSINISQLLESWNPYYNVTGIWARYERNRGVRTYLDLPGLNGTEGDYQLDVGFVIAQHMSVDEVHNPMAPRWIDIYQVVVLDTEMVPVLVWAPFPSMALA